MVGKPERPTPELSSKIQEINFNPYWYVPKSIIYKDLVPKAPRIRPQGPGLARRLSHAGLRRGRQSDRPRARSIGTAPRSTIISFRQLPWAENSLGFIKINFPNKDAVYMHDTPLKSLFGRAVRFESSGCVRVHNVEQLAAWILRDTPGWDYQPHRSMKQTGEQIDVKLTKPVPVYFAYISAWGMPDGRSIPARHLQPRRRRGHRLGLLIFEVRPLDFSSHGVSWRRRAAHALGVASARPRHVVEPAKYPRKCRVEQASGQVSLGRLGRM